MTTSIVIFLLVGTLTAALGIPATPGFTQTTPAAVTTPLIRDPHQTTLCSFPTSASFLPSDMPTVYVDPLNGTADVGESFTISVKVFNLSGRFYTTEEQWEEGEPLPPPKLDNWRYNYSLGYLYAFDLRLRWDPTMLEYVNHTVMVPVEDHAGGILHGPIISAKDTVDPVAGTYALAQSSRAPAPAFNAPDANATAFTMTFTVKKVGKCAINFTNMDLAVDLVGLGLPPAVPPEVPHWTMNGQFQTGAVWTRIEKVAVGARVAGALADPVIHGEDVLVNVSMRNDGVVTDTYNLTLREGATLLAEWKNEELVPNASKTYSYILAGLDVGLYMATASAFILHESELLTDELSEGFTVIDTPTLHINGQTSAQPGTIVTFNASGSVHHDPGGYIVTYIWTLWAAGETASRDMETGEAVSFHLPETTRLLGNWTVMLAVEDNYGIVPEPVTGGGMIHLEPTSQLLRPATEPYRALFTLDVYTPLAISLLAPDNQSYSTANVPLVFTISRTASWLGYSVDGQANVTITGNSTLPALTDGSHSVIVYANDTHGHMGASPAVHFTVDTTPPAADAGADQTVDEDTLVALTGSGSTDNLGIVAFVWTFTDATTKTLTGETPTYTFSTPGVFTVTLNVTDIAGNWATTALTVTVLDVTTPIAHAGNDQTVDAGATVTFAASTSTDNVGIVSYDWAFGDGSSGTGETATHMYANAGEYTVTLTVRDAEGNQATDTAVVNVVLEGFPTWALGAAGAIIVLAIGIAVALWKSRK